MVEGLVSSFSGLVVVVVEQDEAVWLASEREVVTSVVCVLGFIVVVSSKLLQEAVMVLVTSLFSVAVAVEMLKLEFSLLEGALLEVFFDLAASVGLFEEATPVALEISEGADIELTVVVSDEAVDFPMYSAESVALASMLAELVTELRLDLSVVEAKVVVVLEVSLETASVILVVFKKVCVELEAEEEAGTEMVEDPDLLAYFAASVTLVTLLEGLPGVASVVLVELFATTVEDSVSLAYLAASVTLATELAELEAKFELTEVESVVVVVAEVCAELEAEAETEAEAEEVTSEETPEDDPDLVTRSTASIALIAMLAELEANDAVRVKVLIRLASMALVISTGAEVAASADDLVVLENLAEELMLLAEAGALEEARTLEETGALEEDATEETAEEEEATEEEEALEEAVKTLEVVKDADELVAFALVEETTDEDAFVVVEETTDEDDAAEVAGLAGFMVVTSEELAAAEDVEVEEPCAFGAAILDDTAVVVEEVDEVDEEDEDEEDTVLISGSTSSANSPR